MRKKSKRIKLLKVIEGSDARRIAFQEVLNAQSARKHMGQDPPSKLTCRKSTKYLKSLCYARVAKKV